VVKFLRLRLSLWGGREGDEGGVIEDLDAQFPHDRISSIEYGPADEGKYRTRAGPAQCYGD
jgi:hypothetical protein